MVVWSGFEGNVMVRVSVFTVRRVGAGLSEG